MIEFYSKRKWKDLQLIDCKSEPPTHNWENRLWQTKTSEWRSSSDKLSYTRLMRKYHLLPSSQDLPNNSLAAVFFANNVLHESNSKVMHIVCVRSTKTPNSVLAMPHECIRAIRKSRLKTTGRSLSLRQISWPWINCTWRSGAPPPIQHSNA